MRSAPARPMPEAAAVTIPIFPFIRIVRYLLSEAGKCEFIPGGLADGRSRGVTHKLDLAADPCRYAVVGLGRRRARRRLRRRRGAPGARAWGSDAHVASRHRSAHLLGRT